MVKNKHCMSFAYLLVKDNKIIQCFKVNIYFKRQILLLGTKDKEAQMKHVVTVML